MKINVTGGAGYTEGVNNVCTYLSTSSFATNCDYYGTPIHTKEDYIDEINAGRNPVYHGPKKIGSPRLTVSNTSFNAGNYALPQAAGANRLSMYVYLPPNTTNQGSVSVNDKIFQITLDVDPFNEVSGTGHWYHFFHTQGGGWTHVQVDSHPQHNNNWSNAAMWPYPSYSIRGYGVNHIETTRLFYVNYGAYSGYTGLDIPEYTVWLDEVEFFNDPEPQNEETINGLSVLYRPETKYFEIGFHGKYKNNSYDKSTYEIRYSFAPITNDNWVSATPVHVQAEAYFSVPANTTGIIKKYQAHRSAVWAPFKLASTAEEALLTPGTIIYFAIKDVSQDPNNLQIPNPLHNNGRQYATYANTFDYAGDAPALPLIKRIDYFISNSEAKVIEKAPTIKSIK